MGPFLLGYIATNPGSSGATDQSRLDDMQTAAPQFACEDIMANTTFQGPVRSLNGFQTVTVNATTGAVTTTPTLGPITSITDLTASGVVIFSGLPTADPHVVGQLWSNAGVLTVSAG